MWGWRRAATPRRSGSCRLLAGRMRPLASSDEGGRHGQAAVAAIPGVAGMTGVPGLRGGGQPEPAEGGGERREVVAAGSVAAALAARVDLVVGGEHLAEALCGEALAVARPLTP